MIPVKNENKCTPEDIVDDNEADKNEADKIVISKTTLPAPEEKQVDEKELIPEQKWFFFSPATYCGLSFRK